MAVEGCAKIVKYLVFVFNLLFFISGCAILALGIVLHVQGGGFATLVPSLPFLNAGNICIAAGIIVMVVAFVGCCGAIKENACLLLMFFLFLLLIFLLEIVAGIVGFIYRGQVEMAVTDGLIDSLANYDKPNEEGLTKAWDILQRDLMCCGVNGTSDWADNDNFQPGTTPDSCCVVFEDGCGVDLSKEKYPMGCKGRLTKTLQGYIYYIAAGGIVIGVFQVLGMVFAMVLYVNVKRQSSYA